MSVMKEEGKRMTAQLSRRLTGTTQYIIWKNKDALSKLVSPKKPSFESGDSNAAEGEDKEIDLSKGGVTPMQVEQAVRHSGKTGGQTISKPR